jgi:YgiT-type zinc finger domain-containing protein
MNYHSCYYCKGKLKAETVTRLQNFQGRWYLVENVPALVCQQCGEQYFTADAHDLVVDLISGQHEPVRIEHVLVFDAEG